MTHENRKPEADFDRAIAALRQDEPEAKAMETAGARGWERVQSAAGTVPALEQIRGCEDVRALLPAYRAGTLAAARTLLVRDHLRECAACRRAQAGAERTAEWTPLSAPAPRWSFGQWAMAAAAIVVVGALALFVQGWFFAAPAGARAQVQSVEGAVYLISASGEKVLHAGDELAEGDLVRTGGGAHAFVQLRDGSVVEMNERAEFALSARRNDATLKLDQGSIIVQAAKRRRGHLYVATPDCRVAVTGTVFAVNSGMKGSRVSVIEGEVRVAEAGAEHVLHAGEQLATSASMGAVPVRDEIAWSRNLDEHLALLAQFATLQKKFEQIPTPGLRFASTILGRVPANTVVYATIPNLGDALSEANRIFQDQLRQSAALREWWYKGHRQGEGPTAEQVVEKIHVLSQYLGDEVVLISLGGQAGGESNAVILAEVRRQGLAEFLQTEFANLQAQSTGEQKHFGIRVIDQAQLASLPATPKADQMLALVRPDFVLFSGNARALQLVNAQLQAAPGAFAGTEFGQQVTAAYKQGAGFLIAVNLHQIIENDRRNRPRSQAQQRSDLEFDRTGLGDAKYLFLSRRDLSGVPDNRAVLEFAGARHGIASWLAAPAPMGSLEFVSANAGVAASWIAKSPALMLDDILQIASGGKPQEELAKAEAELNLSLRDDLAAAFGGEAALALDGPVLPKPSWKFVAEVNDPQRLQTSLERLIEVVNREAAKRGKPGAQLEQQDVRGQRFYVLRSLDPQKLGGELHYTFAAGYVIAAPTRALLARALEIKAAPENSLARSAEFRSLLPKDGYADFSAVLYQNLGPVVQPLASQLNTQQLQALQQLMADSKPTVICAYGGENRIEVASASRWLPFDLNLMSVAALLGRERAGTSPRPRP